MFGWGFRALALPSWLLLRQTLLQRLPVRGHGRWRPCLTIVVDLSGQGHEMSLVATLLFMRTFFAPSSWPAARARGDLNTVFNYTS